MGPDIVGLAGSLREGSSSLAAGRLVLAAAEAAGARTELLDVAELDLPFFSREATADHPGVRRLVQAVGRAHGLVWSTPLYHGSMSGAFKNALDWLELLRDADPPYLSGRVVALVAAAGGGQACRR
ncbi:MAG: NADPH-dependent FMN reductase [Acidimicrobiales bacterium]